MRLEKELTKNQILEDYLNLVYFGNNAFGIEVAAERYFAEDDGRTSRCRSGAARRADPVAVGARPDHAPGRGRAPPSRGARRDGRDAQDHAAPGRRPRSRCRCRRTVSYPQASQRSYYIDALLDQLANPNPNDPVDPADVLGTTAAEAQARAATRAACKIYTTYDPTLQFDGDLGDRRAIVPQNQTQFTASLVVIDNTNGAVRAIANGRGLRREPVRSRDRRSRPAGRFVVQGVHARGRAVGRLLARTTGVERLLAAAGGSAPGRAADSFYNLSRRLSRRRPDAHRGDRRVRQLRVRAHRALARPRQLRPRRRARP